MNLLAAYLVASLLSYVAATMIAVWYLAPALARRPLAEALTILAWVQAFRYVALQIFSASDVAGLEASLAAQRVIAFGDLATAVLAVVALVALRRGMPVARPLMWVLAIVGTADLISATVTGVAGHLANTASGWSWFILAFYVPALSVAEVLTFWQLIARLHGVEGRAWEDQSASVPRRPRGGSHSRCAECRCAGPGPCRGSPLLSSAMVSVLGV